MANKLTAEERTQVAFKYEKCNSVIGVQRYLRKTYGNHTNVHYRTIWNCHEILLNKGSSANRQKWPKTNKSKQPQNIDTIRDILNVSPEKSVRQLKRECEMDVSESTIFKIVWKELKFRRWDPHYVQKKRVWWQCAETDVCQSHGHMLARRNSIARKHYVEWCYVSCFTFDGLLKRHTIFYGHHDKIPWLQLDIRKNR